VRKKTMDFSVHMFMAKPFMKAVLDAYFTKKEITSGCTQYYDVVKTDGNIYCYFRYTMMQTFSI
jgi:hypothetical protein